MIQSPCKIEFVPEGGTATVLADFGAWLVQLPRFAPAQRIFEADGIDAAASYFKPLGGVTVAITFAVEEDKDDFLTAADEFLAPDSAGTVPLLNRDGELVITGDKSVAAYPAVIARITPGLPFGPGPSTAKAYQIAAGLPVISTLTLD